MPVKAADEWLKEYLDNDQYCNPTNEDWKCKRSLPTYCKGKDDCSYDGTKCICKSPAILLNNGKCGKPTCGIYTDGTCLINQVCKYTPPSTGSSYGTYSCKKK